MGLGGNYKIQMPLTLQDTLNQYSLGRSTLNVNFVSPLVCFGGIFTIASGSTLTLTLSDGSLKQPNGSNAAFAKVRGIWVTNYSDPVAAAASILSMGGGTHAVAWAAASRIIGGPNASEMKGDALSTAGLAVASGSADVVTLSGSGGVSSQAGIVIIGE